MGISSFALLLRVAEEAAEGPASPFEVNFGLFFWTWLVFLILLWVLAKFALPAIVKTTEERERTIRGQLDDAERLHAEAKTAHADAQQAAADARASAQTLLADARAASEKERTAAVEKLRQEQDAMLDRARRDIVDEKERAVAALRREAVDLALAAAGKLIEQRLDADADRKLVSEYLEQLEVTR